MAITKPPITDPFATNPTTQADPDLFAAPSFMTDGYTAPGGNPEIPALGHFNYLFWWAMQAGRYHQSRGIPEWDTNETGYVAGSMVLYSGLVWMCVGAASTGLAPAADSTNWQLWLASPIAASGFWASPIWIWRNARQQSVFFINHMAHPDGRIIQWRERWRAIEDNGVGTASGTFDKQVQPWDVDQGGTGSRIYVAEPGTVGVPTPAKTPYLVLIAGSASSAFARARTTFLGTYHASGREAAVETDFYLVAGEDANPSNNAYTFGFGGVFADDTTLTGAVFEKKSTDANWFAVNGNGSALSARVDTGVPTNPSGQRLRVEWWPAAIADDNVAQTKFYIDGSLVATITSNLPSASPSPYIRVFGGAKRITGTGAACFLGPVTYSAGY